MPMIAYPNTYRPHTKQMSGNKTTTNYYQENDHNSELLVNKNDANNKDPMRRLIRYLSLRTFIKSSRKSLFFNRHLTCDVIKKICFIINTLYIVYA